MLLAFVIIAIFRVTADVELPVLVMAPGNGAMKVPEVARSWRMVPTLGEDLAETVRGELAAYARNVAGAT